VRGEFVSVWIYFKQSCLGLLDKSGVVLTGAHLLLRTNFQVIQRMLYHRYPYLPLVILHPSVVLLTVIQSKIWLSPQSLGNLSIFVVLIIHVLLIFGGSLCTCYIFQTVLLFSTTVSTLFVAITIICESRLPF